MSRNAGPEMAERTIPFVSDTLSGLVVRIRVSRSCPERTSGICPFEGLGHSPVEVFDECQDAMPEFLRGFEAGSFQEPSSQDRKPDLDLIQPGGVFGGVDEPYSVRRIVEEFGSGCHGFKNTRFSLDSKILCDPALMGHKLDKRFGFMGIELISDENPLSFGICTDGPGNVI